MERWFALAVAAALIGVSSAHAQEVPADDLAFDDAERRMTVPVSIAGAGPYPFIIDTGAQRSVISRQLAASLGLPAGRRVGLTAMSGRSEVDTVLVPSLSVSRFAATRVEAPSLDARHLGAPGMLGIDTLQGHRVTINFESNVMSVAAAERRRSRPREPGEIVIEARSLYGQLVVTNATVAGKRVRVVLDTGTPVTLGNMALRDLLARRKALAAPVTLISVTGGEFQAEAGEIRGMALGTARIDGLPVAFADAAPFRAFGLEAKPALFLGMDALRLFRRVDIDFVNRELRLLLPRRVASR